MTRITWTPLHSTMLHRAPKKKSLSSSVPLTTRPEFPHFKKLELSDRETIESFVSKYPPYSDFNFTSLWSYNVHDEAEFSFLNGNLVVKFHDYITAEPFYTFLGTNSVKETIAELLFKSNIDKLTPVLKLIPEISVHELEKITHNFQIEEDHDSHDYIFSVEEHASLTGKKFQDQRNLLNRYKKNANYSKKFIDISDNKIQIELENFFYRWESLRNKTRNETQHELSAMRRLFKSAHHFKLMGTGIFLNNELIGFSIYELSHDLYSITHFEKADNSVKGSSTYLRHETAKYLHAFGYKYINYEQDLGIAGLRTSKKLWQPVDYLKKYKIFHKMNSI